MNFDFIFRYFRVISRELENEKQQHVDFTAIYQNFMIIENQYSFRNNHSAFMPLIHLYSKITSALDNGKYTIRIFLDLAIAFDTVHHQIELLKLEYYGVREILLKWFYLEGRTQQVYFLGTTSSVAHINIC